MKLNKHQRKQFIFHNHRIDTLDTDKVISECKVSAEIDVASVIERGNQPKPITELDHLAYIVEKIENDCSVCPFEFYLKNKAGQLKPNLHYRGMSIEESGKLESYRHFRQAAQNEESRMISENDTTSIIILNFS